MREVWDMKRDQKSDVGEEGWGWSNVNCLESIHGGCKWSIWMADV
jgi:hypothetical protein